MNKFIILILMFFIMNACNESVSEISEKNSPDIIYYNGTIYTVDSEIPKAELVAISDGKIVHVGLDSDVDSLKGANTKLVDLNNRFMYPGFIESHGHLYGLGNMNLQLNLSNTENFSELLHLVDSVVQKTQKGEIILGRGWHQEKWNEREQTWLNGLPDNRELNKISPDNPVLLTRAGGHSALANQAALEKAGVLKNGKILIDGEHFEKFDDGTLTGILHENAVGMVRSQIKTSQSDQERAKIFNSALKICHENGITTFHDAGIGGNDIRILDSITKNRNFTRLYLMLNGSDDDLLSEWFKKGPYYSENKAITVKSVKLYADGALGNRGAWLLEEYTDKPHHHGFPLRPMNEVVEVSKAAIDAGYQICTHAIGDRANREVLNAYEEAFKAKNVSGKDQRFRIEHAQHLHPDDIPRFAELGVIPSMQGIHMASDRPWAIDRLGKDRIESGAYVWQKLIKSGAIIINGTDVPIEPIDVLDCFYACVTRKTLKGLPENGYEADQKMSREQALKSYTINAAYGCFMEDEIGSISVGKRADFTILDQDILEVPEDKIRDTKIISTIINGEEVYNINQ